MNIASFIEAKKSERVSAINSLIRQDHVFKTELLPADELFENLQWDANHSPLNMAGHLISALSAISSVISDREVEYSKVWWDEAIKEALSTTGDGSFGLYPYGDDYNQPIETIQAINDSSPLWTLPSTFSNTPGGAVESFLDLPVNVNIDKQYLLTEVVDCVPDLPGFLATYRYKDLSGNEIDVTENLMEACTVGEFFLNETQWTAIASFLSNKRAEWEALVPELDAFLAAEMVSDIKEVYGQVGSGAIHAIKNAIEAFKPAFSVVEASSNHVYGDIKPPSSFSDMITGLNEDSSDVSSLKGVIESFRTDGFIDTAGTNLVKAHQLLLRARIEKPSGTLPAVRSAISGMRAALLDIKKSNEALLEWEVSAEESLPTPSIISAYYEESRNVSDVLVGTDIHLIVDAAACASSLKVYRASGRSVIDYATSATEAEGQWETVYDTHITRLDSGLLDMQWQVNIDSLSRGQFYWYRVKVEDTGTQLGDLAVLNSDIDPLEGGSPVGSLTDIVPYTMRSAKSSPYSASNITLSRGNNVEVRGVGRATILHKSESIDQQFSKGQYITINHTAGVFAIAKVSDTELLVYPALTVAADSVSVSIPQGLVNAYNPD